MLEVIPVIDLMNSIAVCGKSGDRENYTPLNSVYSSNSSPVSIANSLKVNGAKQIYIADLDLIEKKGHNLDAVKMVNTVLPVMLDAGIRNFDSFKFYLDFTHKLIVATETLESIEDLRKIFDTFPKERIVVSVDIKDGNLFSNNLNMNFDEFKKEIIAIDPNEVILLDISNVGCENGFNKDLITSFSELKDKLIIGGGLNKEGIAMVSKLGVKKVLVGSSLHNGKVKILNNNY